MLKKYGINGTLYRIPHNHEFRKENISSLQDMLSINKDFEIGEHTLIRPHLTKITIAEPDDETEILSSCSERKNQ